MRPSIYFNSDSIEIGHAASGEQTSPLQILETQEQAMCVAPDDYQLVDSGSNYSLFVESDGKVLGVSVSIRYQGQWTERVKFTIDPSDLGGTLSIVLPSVDWEPAPKPAVPLVITHA